MFCRICGYQLPPDALVCPYCGTHVEETEFAKSSDYARVESDKNSGKAIAGFIVSLAGAVVTTTYIISGGIFVALVCGIIGLIFSSLGKEEISDKGLKGKGFATAGFIISIVLITLAAFTLFGALLLALMWAFGIVY